MIVIFALRKQNFGIFRFAVCGRNGNNNVGQLSSGQSAESGSQEFLAISAPLVAFLEMNDKRFFSQPALDDVVEDVETNRG